jgi:uncharacterized protein (TIGR00266 family)
MQSEIRYRPSFAALFIKLQPGESIIAEADAMASMSLALVMTTFFLGGFFRALLRRIFGGESLFANRFSCPAEAAEAELVLTQSFPGDILAIPLNGNAWYLQPGAFLAATEGVTIGVGWAGLRSWFNGEGLFRLKVAGQGTVWIGAYGGIFDKEVAGEYVVDTGHLIAYEPTLQLKLALAGGIFSSFFGGEGFVSRMKGQGKIYLQTRSLDGLAAWTNAHI